MERIIYTLVKDAKKDARRYYERGEYYEQQGNSLQALDNYVDSLYAYAKYIDLSEQADQQRRVDEYLAGQRPHSGGEISYPIEEKVEFLFGISTRLVCIGRYYRDRVVRAYIAEKLKLILDVVSKHQKIFDGEAIKFYNALQEAVEITSDLITEQAEDLEKIKKVKPDNERDHILKKIRVSLLKVSETKICLTPLEADPSCFIATAAYSTSIHPDLDTFRNFRDKQLLTNPAGKWLVNLYYKISPIIAQYIEKQPVIKRFLRQQLSHLAQWMRSQDVK